MANVATLKDSPSSNWDGGKKPFNASYGKLMMWFFLISDAFTFSTLLIVYGLSRVTSHVTWANPEFVFTHFPGFTELLHWHPPLAFVGLMTFILIASSVTMVLAVEAGHRNDKKTVEFYMILTIIGGFAFVSCQAYEWYNFILGSAAGGIHLVDGGMARLLTHVSWEEGAFVTQAMAEAVGGLQLMMPDGELITGGEAVTLAANTTYMHGANLTLNEYCANPLFADLFFFITGFHGSHVASGVLLNIIIYLQVKNGVMEKRGHYEMVEKVGLYWHFVDLVWVFVFTLFYLI